MQKSGGFVCFYEALFSFISQVFSYVLNNTIKLFLSNYMFAGLRSKFCCFWGFVCVFVFSPVGSRWHFSTTNLSLLARNITTS